MDITKLLDRHCARKDLRRTKKKLQSIVKDAHYKKKKADDAINEYLNHGKKKKKNNQKKHGGRRKAEKAAANVKKELTAGMDEEAEYFHEAAIERKKVLKEQLMDDDREIKKYEKLLGIHKRKGKDAPKAFTEDGYGELWEFCDPELRQKVIENDDADDLGLEQLAGPKDSDVEVDENSDDELMDVDSDDSAAEDECDEELDDLERDLMGEDDDDEEEDDIMADESEGSLDGELAEDVEEAEDEADEDTGDDEPEVKEDIYGRKVDVRTGKVLESSNAAGARKKLEELNANSTERAQQRLEIAKVIRRCLNRLNERTLLEMVKTVEDLFAKSSHNDVKEIFTKVILELTMTVFPSPDHLLLVYAAFIALIHINVSADIASHFVESYMTTFMNELAKLDTRDEDRFFENATRLLCHLFHFKVIKAEFIIEVMTKLRDLVSEKTLSLFMHILTIAGGALKKGRAVLLTSFINETQNFYVNVSAEKRESKQMKFLLEELMAIKNGNIAAVTSKYDDSKLAQFVHIIKGLTKNVDNKNKEVPFTLDDILHVAERGRWWVIGSSWQPGTNTKKEAKLLKAEPKVTKFDDKLLALAKKAKMNTVTRRNIFCTIVSSTDEMEAFERLLKLNLKGSQEREVIHILVVCAMLEATYNPYYATLVERFCSFNKRFILTTQFAVWDRIKDLGSLKKIQRINLAFMVADIIQLQAVHLSILKAINFGTIEVTTTAFLRRTFYRLLSKSTNSALTEMITRAIRSESLKLFVQGLRLFFDMSMKAENFADVPDFSAVSKKIDLVKNLLMEVD